MPFINLGTGRTAKSIVATANNTCAILDTGNVVCWGSGESGENGVGNTNTIGDAVNEMGDNLVVVDLNGARALSISSALNHVCALLENNSVKCWGNNFWGQLGLGDANNRGHTAGTMGAALPAVPISW